MMRRMFASPLRSAFLAQLLGGMVAFSLIYISYRPLLQMPLPAAVLQGLCAAFISYKFGAPRWWWWINLAFMPLVVVALALQIPPLWYLGAFVLCLLVFWRTDKSRVPLYLSNATTAEAVAALLPQQPCRLLDMGCGDGRFLRHLAIARPDCQFTGIEHAPATWLLAKLINLGHSNVQIQYGNLWRLPLKEFDVVYAFLSPAPMLQLLDKARQEMQADKLLISNSFPIPDQLATQVLTLSDRRQTQLYCYKPGLTTTSKPRN
jgi:SAM-dependent methyltransferase